MDYSSKNLYKDDVVPALGHDFDGSIAENVTVIEPEFGENGGRIVKCSRCDAVQVTFEGFILFDPNGGTCQTASKPVTFGEPYGELPAAQKEGYSFDGWYTLADGGTKVKSTDPVTVYANHTLYAHWRTPVWTVTFYPNGGSVSPSSKSVTNTSTYGTLPTASRRGYTFDGWFTETDGGLRVTQDSIVLLTADQTLYAHWTVTTWTVTFNANGGVCETAEKTVAYDALYGDLPTPSRTGYTFDGWYTASGSGTKITTESQVSIVSDQILYAHWTPCSRTVFFDPNGGACSTTEKSVTYNALYGNLPVAERTGYTFVGWFTQADGGTMISDSSTVSVTSDQTLYAHWSSNALLLLFNANGGTCDTTEMTVFFAQPYGQLPEPTLQDYVFEGWFTQADAGTKITAESVVSTEGTQPLYAHWKEVTVTAIRIASNPLKLTYSLGDMLDTTGLSVVVEKSDGTQETVLTGFSCTPGQFKTTGEQVVTVAYAGETCTFTVCVEPEVPDESVPFLCLSNVSSRPGTTVDIALSIHNNPGIISTSVSVSYDSTKLRLVGVEDTGLMGTGVFFQGNDPDKNPYTVYWENGLSSENIAQDGVLAVFTFEILDNTEPGMTPVLLNYVQNSTLNLDLEEVGFAVRRGIVEITDSVCGDVSADGVVDLKDVVILQRYLAGGWNVTIHEPNADVNKDGDVNVKDVVLLQRFLAGGWNVTLI